MSITLTEESKTVEVQRSIRHRVEQESVSGGSRIATAIRCGHQQRQRPVLQFLAHLRYALAVPTPAVIDAFT